MVDAARIFCRMKSFKQHIFEGLYISPDGELSYSDTPKKDEQEWIPTKDALLRNRDGTYRTKGNIRDFEFFFAYGIETMSPTEILSGLEKDIYDEMSKEDAHEYISAIRKEFIDAIKHPGSDNNKQIVDELIQKSKARFFAYLSDTQGIRTIDYIVTLPSSSGLNRLIGESISEWFPSAKLLHGALRKAKGSEVKFTNIPGRKGEKKVEPILQKYRKMYSGPRADDEFKMTGEKGIGSSHREYVSNFIISSNPEVLKEIEGKTVLVVDDTIHSANSLLDAQRELSQYNPKKIFGYVFFNEKRSGWR